MMAEVACFCGCLFSFGGGAEACPRCGEVASVMGGRGPAEALSGEPGDTLYVTDIWQQAQAAWPDLDDTVVLPRSEAFAAASAPRAGGPPRLGQESDGYGS